MSDVHFGHFVVGKVNRWESHFSKLFNHRDDLISILNLEGTVNIGYERFVAIVPVIDHGNVSVVTYNISEL